MKKKILGNIAFLSLTMFATSLSSCNSGSRQASGEVTYDSVNIVKSGRDSVVIKADYPVGGNPLFRHAVLERLSEEMGGTYAGSYDSAQAMFQYYADSYVKEMQADDKEVIEAGGKPMPEFRQYDVKKVYETDKFATFVLDQYIFNGGAHGYGITEGFTVRKSDGRVMGFNMLNTLFRSQQQAMDWDATIKKGLMKAWNLKSEDELKSFVFGDDLMIPMPKYPPYFTKDGMVVVYQSDEIAAHAAGKAEIVIPYAKVNEFLNETGKQLIAK